MTENDAWEELPPTLVGQNIRRYRTEQHMKVSTLAYEAGYAHPGPISDIERGRIRPSLRKLKAIAQVLHVQVDDLLRPEEEAFSAIHAELRTLVPRLSLSAAAAFVILARILLLSPPDTGTMLQDILTTASRFRRRQSRRGPLRPPEASGRLRRPRREAS